MRLVRPLIGLRLTCSILSGMTENCHPIPQHSYRPMVCLNTKTELISLLTVHLIRGRQGQQRSRRFRQPTFEKQFKKVSLQTMRKEPAAMHFLPVFKFILSV